MVRPCFLVMDREFAGNISTRKLVIETAKFNVITAYSSQEAIDTLAAFPAVDAAVIDSNMEMACSEVIAALKAVKPELPIILVDAPGAQPCPGADHFLESFDPAPLLMLLEKLVPTRTALIREHSEELARKQQ